MSINLLEVQRETIRYFSEVVELIEKAKMPSEIKSFEVSGGQLNEEHFIKTIASGLPNTGNYIYWFEVDKPEVLLTQFANRERKDEYKLARDNKGVNSQYVYVGSCTKTKLRDRFKQHCGWGPIQTYSLQLKHWLTNVDLKLTFSYVMLEDPVVAAHLEDQLHKQLKPLFGKPGANNKIKKINPCLPASSVIYPAYQKAANSRIA